MRQRPAIYLSRLLGGLVLTASFTAGPADLHLSGAGLRASRS